ncbi:MAG: hypothetical protein INQ03_04035 [Candidatus Heimdallarchaeota archaeon]|nr:hypothetical protein [Candidatus Heimdallarchaeota archaeon]
MDIVRYASIIYCSDLEKSRYFYETILQLEVETDFTSVIFFKESIAIWEIKSAHLLSNTFGEAFFKKQKKPSFPFELYFEIRSFDTFIQQLQNYPIDYIHDVYQEPWGQRTVRFYDPDKNIIEIGETLEEFINRMHQEGLSVEEIAEINGLNVKVIEGLLKLSI